MGLGPEPNMADQTSTAALNAVGPNIAELIQRRNDGVPTCLQLNRIRRQRDQIFWINQLLILHCAEVTSAHKPMNMPDLSKRKVRYWIALLGIADRVSKARCYTQEHSDDRLNVPSPGARKRGSQGKKSITDIIHHKGAPAGMC
jgi:hypothetical protein